MGAMVIKMGEEVVKERQMRQETEKLRQDEVELYRGERDRAMSKMKDMQGEIEKRKVDQGKKERLIEALQKSTQDINGALSIERKGSQEKSQKINELQKEIVKVKEDAE